MSDELFLFGDDDQPSADLKAPTPIAEWQVDLLRKALDARGLTSMNERQAAIERAAGRAVSSLHELTSDEALQSLNVLGQATRSARSTSTAWDERDEDTWIDRL